jgi:hypothetical protein
MTEAKDFKRFIRTYSVLKNERLNANIKLTLRKALGVSSRHLTFKIAPPTEQSFLNGWKFSKMHTGP